MWRDCVPEARRRGAISLRNFRGARFSSLPRRRRCRRHSTRAERSAPYRGAHSFSRVTFGSAVSVTMRRPTAPHEPCRAKARPDSCPRGPGTGPSWRSGPTTPRTASAHPPGPAQATARTAASSSRERGTADEAVGVPPVIERGERLVQFVHRLRIGQLHTGRKDDVGGWRGTNVRPGERATRRGLRGWDGCAGAGTRRTQVARQVLGCGLFSAASYTARGGLSLGCRRRASPSVARGGMRSSEPVPPTGPDVGQPLRGAEVLGVARRAYPYAIPEWRVTIDTVALSSLVDVCHPGRGDAGRTGSREVAWSGDHQPVRQA